MTMSGGGAIIDVTSDPGSWADALRYPNPIKVADFESCGSHQGTGAAPSTEEATPNNRDVEADGSDATAGAEVSRPPRFRSGHFPSSFDHGDPDA